MTRNPGDRLTQLGRWLGVATGAGTALVVSSFFSTPPGELESGLVLVLSGLAVVGLMVAVGAYLLQTWVVALGFAASFFPVGFYLLIAANNALQWIGVFALCYGISAGMLFVANRRQAA